MTTKRKSKGISLAPYLIGIMVPLSIFAVYIGYRVYSTDKLLIPISVFALLAGLFFEYRRISDNWAKLFATSLFAFILSFFAFLPGEHERNYFLDDHIELWPYTFCFFFIVFAIAFSGKKIIPNLAVGITLLQSIAIIYWIIDVPPVTFNLIIILKLIGLFFAAYSIYFGFSYDKISRFNRLYLSTWSSIIMLVFAVDNIYELYQNAPIEKAPNIVNAAFIAAQFFLLGVSSIYIVQNYFMLVEFIPGKGRFFNARYFKEIDKLKKEHIARYSRVQVSKAQSLFCLLFAGIIYALNYIYNFLPRNFLIWTTFVLFPILINIFEPKENVLGLPNTIPLNEEK